MPIGESLNFNPDIPEFEAIIQNALPESLLKVTGKYMTSQVYDKTLTYKGKEYKPGPMQMIFVNETYLNVMAAPANYRFQVGGKTFQIGSDRKRITIISGGEPILWREAVADPQSYDPVDSVGTPLQGDECRITNGLAATPFSYFYMTGGVGGILQSIPLQDGTVFRQRKPGGVPGSQSYAWYRFSRTTGGGGFFREVDTVLDVYIATIKNIDFTKLGDLAAIIDAMDTVNGKPFDAKFFRDTKYRIELALLLNAQTDSRQNGIYFLSAVEGDNTASTISRISPFLKWTYGYIGRTKVAVWQGDRFGQDEMWLSSDKAIGATGKDPRVHFDTTPHVWIKSKPDIAIEERVYANLEKIEKLEEELEKVSTGGIAVEADPVASKKIDDAKAELQAAIDAIPDPPDLSEIKAKLEDLDLTKADKTSVAELDTALAELTALMGTTATDEELAEAITKVNDLIAKVDAKTGVVTEKDPVAMAALTTLQGTVDKLPTSTVTDGLKTSLTALEKQYASLDLSKAKQTELDAATAAIKALQDAMAALPAAATPAQLAALEARVKAVEGALSQSENSKGILIQDPRAHFMVGGNLYGGMRRLVEADISSLNQRVGFEAENPYRCLNGSGQTGMPNGSNQWLTYLLKSTLRLWRLEISHINSNWAIRTLKRNGTEILKLPSWQDAAAHTSVYKVKAVAGHEALSSVQIVDDAPAITAYTNLYCSISDTANPAVDPVVNGVTLKVGDRFRFQDESGAQALMIYQGTHSASGAWWAKPVTVAGDPDLARYSVVNPQINQNRQAIEALEKQVVNVGNTITRFEPRIPTQQDVDGTWHIWEAAELLGTTAVISTYKWGGPLLPNEFYRTAGPSTIQVDFSESAAKFDSATGLWTIGVMGLSLQYSKVPGALKFQLPGADSRFTNLAWKAFDALGDEISGGGGLLVANPTNPDYLTNISLNPAVAQGRVAVKIRIILTPLGGGEDIFYEFAV